MSNRKNKVEFIVTGINYYNSYYRKRGTIDYDKLIKAKNLLNAINTHKIWGKDIRFYGIYDSKDLNDSEIMDVMFEMFGNVFIEIDKIELIKNTKTIKIKDL